MTTCASGSLFARVRRSTSWPIAFVLAIALLFGTAIATEAPMPHLVADVAGSAPDADCAGHDMPADAPAGVPSDGGCCGVACGCAFAHAIGPLPGAAARPAFEPECPIVRPPPPLHANVQAPPLRPPIA